MTPRVALRSRWHEPSEGPLYHPLAARFGLISAGREGRISGQEQSFSVTAQIADKQPLVNPGD